MYKVIFLLLHFPEKLTLTKTTLHKKILFYALYQTRDNIMESDSENMNIEKLILPLLSLCSTRYHSEKLGLKENPKVWKQPTVS